MDKKEEKTAEEAGLDSIQNRVILNRVVIDTPALLKMIKHCQDCKEKALVDGYSASGQNNDERGSKARGHVMGVLKKEISDKHHDLFITQTQAAGSKSWGKDLKSMDSMDSEA